MKHNFVIGLILIAALGTACGFTNTTPRPTPTLAAPPLAILTIGGNEQTSGQGSYCWRDEDGRPLCVDMIGIPTAQEPLLAGSPFAARLSLSIEQPLTTSLLDVYPVTDDDQFDSEARGSRWWRPKRESRERFELPLEIETIVELSLEPSLYVLYHSVGVQGKGSAAYGFLVEVR